MPPVDPPDFEELDEDDFDFEDDFEEDDDGLDVEEDIAPAPPLPRPDPLAVQQVWGVEWRPVRFDDAAMGNHGRRLGEILEEIVQRNNEENNSVRKFKDGDIVRVAACAAVGQHNGNVGKIVGYNPDARQYAVQVVFNVINSRKSVKGPAGVPLNQIISVYPNKLQAFTPNSPIEASAAAIAFGG